MTEADRPIAVRRWVRRPLLYAAAVLVAIVVFDVLDRRDIRAEDRDFARGIHANGVIDREWGGEGPLQLTYFHPEGHALDVEADLWRTELRPEPGDHVQLEIARSDPTQVRLVGDRRSPGDLSPYLLTLVPLAAWAARVWSLRRATELASSDGVAFQMTGVASYPGLFGRRWRLHLYPLDAPIVGPPVCTVPLVSSPTRFGPRIVEVKGSPRPYGRVVVRDQQSGDLLWPSGRALRSHGFTRSSISPATGPLVVPRVQPWLMRGALVTFGLGLLVMETTTDIDDVLERDHLETGRVVARGSTDVDGTEVDVIVHWPGGPYDARVTVDPDDVPSIGDDIEVAIDPRKPTRIWSPDDDPPVSEGLGAGGLYLASLGLVIAGVVVKRSAFRSARGFPGSSASDNTGAGIAFQPTRRIRRRPTVRLTRDGLVLTERDGSPRVLSWDDHLLDGRPTGGTWHLSGISPSRFEAGGVELVEEATRSSSALPTRRRIAVPLFRSMWEILPALTAYLGSTPTARACLDDPERTQLLLQELASNAWRHRDPPLEPMLGDKLDLHYAVQKVVDRHLRTFEGRAVRGEPVPPTEKLVDQVRLALPVGVAQRLTDDKIANRIERVLATGRWPFDTLLPPAPPPPVGG